MPDTISNTSPITIDINEYDFDLPKDRIALYPANPRSSSKLLVIDRAKGQFEHHQFAEIVSYFRPGDILVLNDSKVFPARLNGHKKISGGKVEIFLLRKFDNGDWEALVKPGRRIQPGTIIEFADGKFSALIGERTEVGGRRIKFTTDSDLMDLIWQYGEVPLPPYIARPAEEKDKATYQTIYAKNVGAVAAPTAGFHFTEELLEKIKAIGVSIVYVTLHPGLGTFRLITVTDATLHKMEEEYFSIKPEVADTINLAMREKRRIIAVGTTTVRALESGYDDKSGQVIASTGRYTSKFIYPPYQYKVVDCLSTNFHIPKSTLLLLVSALAGKDRVLSAYKEAVDKGYRFYSYGDAMLIV
jgi:S-adenosylmethionine:tRNA ribosyltransferase-isomerase